MHCCIIFVMALTRRSIWLFALGVAMIGLLALGTGAPTQAGTPLNSTRKGTYIPMASPPPGAQQVKIGFYPVAIYDLDQASNTFYADTYVWLRWKGDIDPSATIEFTNMVEEWGKLIEPLMEKPKDLPDGSKYQQFRVEGRFVQPFSLADYPLDHHNLDIRIEDTSNGVNQLAYVLDETSTGIDQRLEIPGWKLKGWKSEILEHAYGTNFGEIEQPSSYSVANFEMVIERPLSFFLWKQMLPLAIVVMAALVGLLVNPRSIDARLALPMGALLSAIFLQRGYSDTLPDLGYLVFMDKIYLVAYPLILIVLIRAIVAFAQAGSASDAEIEQIQKVDRKVVVVLGIAFAVGTSVITALR
ncbi:MAG: hypothetical protein WCI65_04610 [Synechococcaceae cyanobacterium ELA263]